MKVVTVIINFNSGEYIFECIESVSKQTLKTEIIVIDNNSTDGSSAKLRLMASSGLIKYIYLKKNIGSSAANNLGMQILSADAYFILNADIILDKDYLKNCVDELLNNVNTAAVVGKLLNYYNNDIIDSCGVDLYFECIPVERGANSKNTNDTYSLREKVFAVCCAASLYRVSALDKIKNLQGHYFDQNYFAFYEDLDLSYRLNIENYDNVFIPNAIAYHVRGGSTKEQSDFVKYLCILNSDLFYLKYMSPYFKYKFYRLFHLLHRILIYRWPLLFKVHRDLKKIEYNPICDLKLNKFYLSKFIKNSYYKMKLINFFK